EELQQRMREREALQGQQAIVPLRPLAFAATPQAGRRPHNRPALRLIHDMDRLAVVFLLEPTSGGTSDHVIRLPLVSRGEQWIAPPPGRYHLAFIAGDPAGGPRLEIDCGEHDLAAGAAFEMTFDERVENQLRARLRERAERLLAPPSDDSDNDRDGPS